MNLKRQDHLETLIGSIEIMFNNARNKGILRNKEIHLLNLINKLINYEGKNLINDKDKKKLSIFYFRLIAKYKILCRSIPINKPYSYQNHLNLSHIPDECYIANNNENIYYWQESNFTDTIINISPKLIQQGFFNDKLFDTKINFNTGVDCVFSEIGYISLAILNTGATDTYKIYDYLNNDITHMFKRIFIDEINTILFVSDNIYSHGTTNIKLKKINQIFDDGIFNDVFNDIFN